MKADKNEVLMLLKTARGQMEGIINMVEEDRYCVDIANQVLSANSILSKVVRVIMKGHIENCVRDSFGQGDNEEKIQELLSLMEKMSK